MNLPEFIYTVLLKPKPLKAAANVILKLIIPESVNMHGATVYLNPNDPVISGALTLGLYEKDEIAFFTKYFAPEMNLVDIGANVGLYSGLALSTPGFSGSILCLEPHSESRDYLQKTINANRSQVGHSNVYVSDKAASDKDESLILYKNSQNKGDNRLYADDILDTKETIEASTLDKLCFENKITKVNFLKIDVQGFEARAIAGARNILSQSEDCILLSEFWPTGIRTAGDDPALYLDMLKELGFKLFRLEQEGSVSLLDGKEAISSLKGRQYMNIAGFKGLYLEGLG